MRNYIFIFVISLVFGFSVLLFRLNYEKETGEQKSHWNVAYFEKGDSKNFFDRAVVLSEGKHYFSGCENAPVVAFFRPPVYPGFMALIFGIFGVSPIAVIISQIFVTSFIVCLVFSITKLIFNNIIVSWISGILMMLYYPMWNDAMIINSELLSMLIGLLAFYLILKFYYSEGKLIKYLCLGGILIGFASLTRGQFFFYSLLLPVLVFGISNVNLKKKINFTILLFVFALVPILLWSFYAYVSSGVIIFISSQGPLAIWWGWSPVVVLEQKYPLWNPLWDVSFIKDDMIGFYLPVKSSMWFINEALNFIVKYPVDSVKIAYFKLLDSWGFIELYSDKNFLVKLIKVFKFNWDLFLAIPGWFLFRKKKVNNIVLLYIAFSCLLYTVISIMTAGLIRYRIPFLDPLLIVLASYTVYYLYSYYKFEKSKIKLK